MPNVSRSAFSRKDALAHLESRSDPVEIELIAGLSMPQASVSPKYLYDVLGSRLFTAICELDEYYPTRTEAAIFEANLRDIASRCGHGMTLIDLGAGDSKKAERLFPFLQPRQYVAVDISADFLKESLDRLRERFKNIDIQAVETDFSSGISLPEAVRRDERLFCYPGSSIGNFTRREAAQFLITLRAACDNYGRPEGGILLGVDLVKDEAVLNAAYDDALGVTAAFNLNLLRHLNRVLDADFRVQEWRHKAFFNTQESRIEMHLVAQCNMTVHWRNGERRFERGETIHTESSYKYTRQTCLALLEEAGFGNAQIWVDPKNWFMVCHAKAI